MSNFLKKFSSSKSNQSHIVTSFFDEPNSDAKNTSFWSKEDILKDNKKFNLSTGFFFYKKSKKKFGELKPVYLCLFKNYLVSSKTKDWSYRQYKSIDLSAHFVVLQKTNVSSGKYAAGIVLSYNGKHIELFAKTNEDLNSFQYQIKKNVVQMNFEELYSLDRKLGSGSYADVYRVRDRITRRDFAAKFFDMSSFRDVARSKIALKNEIIIHRQLEHGNLCKLHEIFETPTHIILVLEYIKGERLIDYVIDHSPLTEKESMIIMKELLEGLLYLHSLGIVHRDLKLENIMMHKDKKDSDRITVKLIDFGLSVNVDNVELFKRSGTPGYVAPEVLLADTYDCKVDVFSAGVILFTMLSGRSPFVGPDRATVLRLNKKCEYQFKPKHWDNKSFGAKDLVKKMMELVPEKRLDVGGALKHRWFTPLKPEEITPPVQSQTIVNSFGKLPMSNRSLSPSPLDPTSQTKTTERTMEKSRTTVENKNQNNEKLSSRIPVKAMTINSQTNSNSIQTLESNAQKQLSMQHTMKSNLLQIPQQYNMLSSLDGSEDEKSEFEGSYDGMMNKASLRSFYKLDSGNVSEGPHSEVQFSQGGQSGGDLMFDATTDIQDANAEAAEVYIKIKSLGNLEKSMRSPFRTNSRIEPNVVVSYEDKNYQKKTSCDLPSETFEQPAIEPKKSEEIKATMLYIKQKSQLENMKTMKTMKTEKASKEVETN